MRGQDRPVVRNVSFKVGSRESYGLVGESGSGKSTVALALTRYLARNGRVSGGSIGINGLNPLAMSTRALRELRARTVSMVYQEPGRALNPSIKAGRQIAEVFEIAGLGKDESLDRAEDMLRQVQIADPGRVMDRYPHELSGGMAQRVVIAMALATEPALLILDEPTTALDATVEAEMLDLVAGLREQMSTSVLFISHNLAVVAKMCDRVGVLYAGELVEEGPASEVFASLAASVHGRPAALHPAARPAQGPGRLDAIPGFLPQPGQVMTGCIFAERCSLVVDECRQLPPPGFEVGPGAHRPVLPARGRAGDAGTAPEDLPPSPLGCLRSPTARTDPIVTIRSLDKTFGSGETAVKALNNVNIECMRGETLGLVGESGSGKTTLARALLGLIEPDPGSVIDFDTVPLAPGLRRRPLDQLRSLQIVFQNPDSALNRRRTVRWLISQPLRAARRPVRQPAGRAPDRPGQVGQDGKAPPAPATRAAVRRAEAAGRDRAGVRRRTPAGGLRRADLGARRVGAGGDPQPARRSAGQRAGHVPVHLARPWRRAVPVRPDRRALPGPGARTRPSRDRCSPDRTTPTPRRCSPRCRAWTASAPSGLG